MIYDLLLKNSDLFGSNIALKDSETVITYSELNKFSQNLASNLKAAGLKKGESVMLLMPNTKEFVIAFFGVVMAGAVAVFADIKFNNELLQIIDENQVKFIITDSYRREKAESFASGLKIDIIVLQEESDCYTQSKHEWKPEKLTPDSPAMVLYTSGSTGKPKGILNSHATLEMALWNYSETVEFSLCDKLVGVTPFFHSYSFGSCMLAGLNAGAELLLQQSFQPRKIIELIKNEKITVFNGVPFMYRLICEQLGNYDGSLDSLRFCVSAGNQLFNDTALDFFKITGKVIHQEYGSSETGTMAINLSDDVNINIESVGRPLKHVNACIKEEDGNNLIYIKSPGIAIGYVGQDEFTRDYYQTGDIGEIDENGFIYIRGRVKRLINTAGLKVNPAEVEEVLQSHPRVVEVTVKGRPDRDFGEIVEAIIVSSDKTLCEQELIDYCRKSVATFKVPKIITFVDSLKKSGTGKAMSIN